MENTIKYNGRNYNAEIIESYYDSNVCLQINADTKQEFFEKYIELVPDFVDLFEYDFYPIVD